MAITKYVNCANTADLLSQLKVLVKSGDGSTNYITCDNTWESWETLLKQLIVVDDAGTLYLSVVGLSSSGSNFTTIVIGDGAAGSWRWTRDGSNNLIKQKNVAGVWTTVDTDLF